MFIKFRPQAPSVTAPTRGPWMPGCRSVYISLYTIFAFLAQTNSLTYAVFMQGS